MSARSAMTLAAIAGCTWGEPPSPLVTGVTPGELVRGTTTVLSIQGERFEPALQVDFDDPAGSPTCADFRVELRAAGKATVALEEVRHLSPAELRAHVPGSLDRADWDVVVVDPAGRAVSLPHGVKVEGCEGPCDDGDPCTAGDACTGAAKCEGTAVADSTPCDYPCASGAVVPGSCLGGACSPTPGFCDPIPPCSVR